MLKWITSRVLWGVLLIFGGVLFLLQNLGIFQGGGLFWTIVFGLGGLFFLSVFLDNRIQWWALIPGFILIGVAFLVGLDTFFPNFSENIGGFIIVGAIGLSFILVYVVNRSNWWALIPAGVMLTTAAVILFEDGSEMVTGGVFFIGLGLTFALVAILPTPQGALKWAWIPAAVLFVMGLAFFATVAELMKYLWPSALILIGLFFIYRAFLSRGR